METGFEGDWARGGHAQTVTDFAVWWNISLTTQPDGNVIKVGKAMTLIGGRQSELVLENVKREDLGAFTCLAKNSLGEASALLILPGDFLCNQVLSSVPMVQFTSQLLARREAVRPPWD